ncbi:hypothetical protein AGR3A_pa70112 [Agrobacterium tomkonis CFBP 6623]|uniref:Uncharacterized protein n=1 Tax=Agrobacterium tomkonis CFBP 6623 TaxID=1183432 RepID=A0A1S7SAT8_9HYPH|nr:hypothetical protein AGR3A_pa70112 [Agrobacterium tomkonis CFBP 6623]
MLATMKDTFSLTALVNQGTS